MTPSEPSRRPSSIDALGEAISHMRNKLFPFNFVGWVTLGFVSLLESCGSGGGTGGLQNRLGRSGSLGDPSRIIESALGWIAAHMIIFVSVLMALMLLSLLFVWLRSRTVFVYIDDVASGRFDLVRPWNEHGARADSFFVLSLIVQGASFILVVLLLGLSGLFVLWARAHDWGGAAIVLGAIPLVILFVLSLLAAALLDMVLRDFVAPLQISRNVGAREAGGVFISLLGASPGPLISYTLLKFVLSIAVGLFTVIVSCLTCCIGALPLVNQTLFQPIYFAERAWSLRLLAQMGEDVFARLSPPPTAPPEAELYDRPTATINIGQVNPGPTE